MKRQQISYNHQLNHEYFTEEKITCGIILKGNEVKSLRENGSSLKGVWATVQNNHLMLRGMHIKNWSTSNNFDLLNEDRERELLVNKRELRDLQKKVKEAGYTLVPEEIYFNEKNLVKVTLCVCKGKHSYDKRNDLKEKQMKRDAEREVKF